MRVARPARTLGAMRSGEPEPRPPERGARRRGPLVALLLAGGLGGAGIGLGWPAGGPAPAAGAGQAAATPVVWVQAGHAPPREPGYRAQTGTSSGPFRSEVAFTTAVARRVAARLRAAGVDARRTPGRVTPLGTRGAVFLSIHHDAPGGAAAVGHAIAGAGENWYRGEGWGRPRPVPYPDSVRHRPATVVSAAVERRSRDLARRLAARHRAVYTPRNGARGRFAGSRHAPATRA